MPECGPEEGWRKSFASIVWKSEEVLHRVNEDRNILRTITRRLTGWVTSCLVPTF